MKVAMPRTTEGMPSSRKSHCHPAMPCLPENSCMIQPDSGPPTTPEIATAVMNNAMIRPRLSCGNQ